MVVPIYNAELAPSSHRGRLVSLNQLAITAGIMVSFLADLLAAKFEAGWRVALGAQCVFGTFLIVGMLFLPETPRWVYPSNCYLIRFNIVLCVLDIEYNIKCL